MIRKGGIIRIGDIVELGVFLSVRVPFLLLSFAFPSCIELSTSSIVISSVCTFNLFSFFCYYNNPLCLRVISYHHTTVSSINFILNINICQDL